jgi:glutamyl-tRNA synthetase
MFNTRIAPSPTGDMHIGTARTAYFNWLAARASGGKFLLRIDDTDLKRSNPDYVKVITDTLDWMGLDYDYMAYQSNHFVRYEEVAETLLRDGKAVRDGDCIRLKASAAVGVWQDEVGGDMKVTSDDLEYANNMVLMKSDGSPTYNFATVVDDIDLNINYIIRGVDHINNTSKQIVLFDLLGERPKFAHVGLICEKGKPLSKRDGASSMLHYKANGYDPDAMLNYLARMGWGPVVDDKTTAVLPKDRMRELFLTGGNMRSAYSNIDQSKLDSFDRKYKARKRV